LRICEPQGYLQFLRLQERAALVITDSGGIKEETTFLGVPCLTLRDTTERPITVTVGTNKLIGRRPERLHQEVRAVLAGTEGWPCAAPLGRLQCRQNRELLVQRPLISRDRLTLWNVGSGAVTKPVRSHWLGITERRFRSGECNLRNSGLNAPPHF